MKFIESKFTAYILLVVFSLFFYYPVLFQGKMYTAQDWGRGDITHFNYPLHHLYAQSLKHFSFPFLTDIIYSGFPLGAEGQVGMFYLPNLLLYFLFPTYEAFGLSFWLLSVIATFGMYSYSRLRNCSNLASLFAACTFGYSMFFASHLVHMNMVQAFSLIPWFFVLIELCLQRGAKWYFFLAIALLEQQLLFIGHPQIALYTAAVLLPYTYFRSNKNQKLPICVLFCSAIVCGILLAMVQLLPTWELSKDSPSTKLESAASTLMQYPYRFRDLAYFILPSPFGSPATNTYSILLRDGIYWENNTFSGSIALVFVILLLVFNRKKRNHNLILALGIFCVLLIFSTGWIYFLAYIPPFSLFRLPQRALVLALFFFSLLSAYGFDAVFKRLRIRKAVLKLLGVAVISAQLLQLTWSANAYNNPIAKSLWLDPPRTVKQLEQSGGRIYSIGGVQLWEKVYTKISHGWSSKGGETLLATRAIMDPNRNAIYNLPSIEGYAKLVPLRTLASLSLIREGITETDTSVIISSDAAKLLSLQGVTSVVTTKPITNNSFKQIAALPEPSLQTIFYLYKNPTALPIIRPVTILTSLPRTGTVTARDIIADEATWQTTVAGEDPGITKRFSNDVSIRSISLQPDKISFQTRAKETGLVVIARSYDKQWKATWNTTPLTVMPLNINSMGIVIPKGNGTVLLTYDLAPYRTGLIISFIGLLATILGCAVCFKYGTFQNHQS